jgi:hypothetical protein
MNAVGLRTEIALAEYLSNANWPNESDILIESGSKLLLENGGAIINSRGLGVPSVLTSFEGGGFEVDDEPEGMPNFPRVVIRSSSVIPVHPTERTCEVDVAAVLQLSADDTGQNYMMITVQAFDDLLQRLFVDQNISDLDSDDDHVYGGFSAQYATPTDFGVSETNERARTFSRSMTIFAAANAITT